MELLRYQKLSGLTWRALADKIGIPHPNLHAIAHGKRECSMERARLIEDATDHDVTANDINAVRRRYLDSQQRKGREERGVEPAEAAP